MEQYTSSRPGSQLKLIPPLSEDFFVYGGHDVNERARQWALGYHYLLVNGIPKCAHGLYLLDTCPGECYSDFRALDHINIWLQEDGRGAFLLSHPYSDDVGEETRNYAKAHGLHLLVDELNDGWYHEDALSVRMQIPDNWPLWPIEAEAAILLHACPVRWPDE